MNQYLKLIFTQTLQFIIMAILFRNAAGQPWFQNKARDTAILLISYVIFLLIPFLSWIFRPITIKINQESRLGKGITLTPILLEEDQLKTVQTQRTMNLSVEVSRRGSIWWKIFIRFFLKNRKINVYVEPSPGDLSLQAKDQLQVKEIMPTNTGFVLNLNDIINNLSNKAGSFAITKSYPYFITNHPDIHIPYNLTAVVYPRLSLEDKPSFWLKLFIKYESNNHQIGFFRR